MNRKTSIGIIIGIVLAACFGAVQLPRNANELAVYQDTWQTAGTITASQTALDVNDRDATFVDAIPDANKVMIKVSTLTNKLETRFQTSAVADANDHVVNHYVSRGSADHWDLATVLTLTSGEQQADGGAFFIDTITITETFNNAGTIVNSDANGIARYDLDVDGYSDHLFIATTLDPNVVLTPQFASH